MRRFLILAPLALLAACHRTPPSILNGVEPEPVQNNPMSEMNFALGDPGYIPAAEMQPRAVAALRTILPGAEGARYDGLRLGRLGAICGTVRVGEAPARAFLVTPDGSGAIAAGPRIDMSRTADAFVAQYVRYCASEEDVGVIGNQALPAPAPAPVPDASPAPVPATPRPPMQPERWQGPATERVSPTPDAPNSFRDAVRPPR